MGYNTVGLILNDAADGLKKDPDVGAKMLDAILTSSRDTSRATDFSIGNHCNGGSVLHSEHADHVQIVAAGGNCIIRLGTVYWGWKKMTDPVALLKDLADQMGYRLVKKPERK